MQNLQSQTTQFLDSIFIELEKINLDLSSYPIDHIAYQTDSAKTYDELKPEFLNLGILIREPLVGERRVGVFELKNHLIYKDKTIGAIELIEPKEGEVVSSGLEHVEFLIPEQLELFMEKHPNLNWDDSNLNREEFPMLKLPLQNGLMIKFPRSGILQV